MIIKLEINDEIDSVEREVQASMVCSDRNRPCVPFIDGAVGAGRTKEQ
jgi:hypothetical protein